MKKRRIEVETQIDNFVKAIGMGIVTETTKSTLLALEAERKQLDDELARQSIKLKSFSKEEIKASIAEFAKYDYSTPKQKRALLNTFVSKLEISDGCEIKGQFNLFGYLPSVQFNLDDMTIVRINASLPRQWPCIRTIYVYKYGFAMTFRMPRWNKPILIPNDK
jgi:hypothetical protein